ncbi:MAG: apolipoprotein N-acyltransferase [Holosporaceae bacterium]|jgi:apolipoprotein N-acyltransferase|nr:apolipoprotein N-acyltransferase [Holosporaceae bacterium]
MLKNVLWGASTALSFAPFNIFPIFLIAFARLFAQISEIEKKKRLLSETFCFFFGMHAACLYWIVCPLSLDPERHWVLIPFAVLLLPAWPSILLLAPTLLLRAKILSRSRRRMRGRKIPLFRSPCAEPFIFALMFSWTFWFYGNYLPGFPWVLPGYVWGCHEIFLQTLSVWGIYGLSFATLLIAGFFGLFFRCCRSGDFITAKNAAFWAIFIFGSLAAFGRYRLENNPTEFTDKKIRIVQADISQQDKQNADLSWVNLKEHMDRSEHKTALNFVVWPEASIPFLYRKDSARLHEYLQSFLKEGEHLLAGAVRKDLASNKVYNSVVVINHRGENVAVYDKSRLLPFGEYVPFRKYLPFQSIASDIGDFDVGSGADVFDIGGMKIIFAICYEVAFRNEFIPTDAGFMSRSRDADVIVNVTNDGWFGFTTEPFQHLQISRAAATESGLPLVRAVNCGISAVFDPCGREIARIDVGCSGIIDANVPRKIRSFFGEWGQSPVLLLICQLLCLFSIFM